MKRCIGVAGICLALWGLETVSWASSYDSGRIHVKETRSGAARVAEFRAKNPVPAGELIALTHLHMAQACGKKFYFQNHFEQEPRGPAGGAILSARTEFECRTKPGFFGGDPAEQELFLREICGEADTQAEYLQAVCSQVLRKTKKP